MDNYSQYGINKNGIGNSIGGKIHELDIEGKIELEAGTVSNPSLHFEDAKDTGLYEISTGVVGMSVGGINQTEWNPTNGFTVGNLSYPELNSIKAQSADSNSRCFNIINSTGNYVVNIDDNDTTKKVNLLGDLDITGTITAGAGLGSAFTDPIAIGTNAGSVSQGIGSVAIGTSAGRNTQEAHSIAIGANSGENNQGYHSVAIGYFSGKSNQGIYSVSIGRTSGFNNQGDHSVAVGHEAGRNTQGDYSVAIGYEAGETIQGDYGVAIGYQAGYDDQAVSSIAIGTNAGSFSQGGGVAIGENAGHYVQALGTVAIGEFSGQTNQGAGSVSVGYQAGGYAQGGNSIAIGQYAGQTSQHSGSIIINSSGTALNSDGINRLYIDNVRNNNSNTKALCYNTTSKEITYSTSGTKTFVIPHPVDENKYLIHGCLEGPEAGVYYRGKGYIKNGECQVSLPDYTQKFTDFSVNITPIYNGRVRTLNSSLVVGDKFNVYGEDGLFHWVVFGKRHDVDVEPLKKNINIKGSGPYKWVE